MFSVYWLSYSIDVLLHIAALYTLEMVTHFSAKVIQVIHVPVSFMHNSSWGWNQALWKRIAVCYKVSVELFVRELVICSLYIENVIEVLTPTCVVLLCICSS